MKMGEDQRNQFDRDEQSHQVTRQTFNEADLFDCIEEQFRSNQENEGYNEGFERGSQAGREEGHLLGEDEGSKRGLELGYFYGFAMTYKHLLFSPTVAEATQQQLPATGLKTTVKLSREEKLLDDLLKLIEEYPRTNETNCEEKMKTIRVKFRQAFGENGNSGLVLSCRQPKQQKKMQQEHQQQLQQIQKSLPIVNLSLKKLSPSSDEQHDDTNHHHHNHHHNNHCPTAVSSVGNLLGSAQQEPNHGM